MERLQITELIHLIFDILRFPVLQVLFQAFKNPPFENIQLKNKEKKILKKMKICNLIHFSIKGIPLVSLKKCQPVRFSHLAGYREHTNVLFYFIDMFYIANL